MKLKNKNTLPVDYSDLSSNFETGIGTLRNIDLCIKSCSDDASNEAESVDSGCVPDLTPETNWLQVSSTLKYEYDFIKDLLQHTIPKCPELSNTSESKLSTTSGDKIIRYSDVKDQAKRKEDKEKAKKNAKNENEQQSVDTEKSKEAERKKKIEIELRKLNSGKYGNLSYLKAKKKETKLRKKLKVMSRKKEKGLKKIKKEENALALANLMSNNEATTENRKIYNNSGQLVYSKFDFSHGVKEKWQENKKRDLNYYLNKVIKEKEKIKSLKSQGNVTDAAKCLESSAWKNAMRKAQGEKVKDDSQKLKKSLDRKMNYRKKSQAKWNERINNVKKNQTIRQQTREKNIKLRKGKQEEKKEKKFTRKDRRHQKVNSKKKKGGTGSRVPGF